MPALLQASRKLPAYALQLCAAALLLLFACASHAQAPAGQTLAQIPEIHTARRFLEEGKPADAESILRAYLDTHLASAEARYLLAFALERENKPKESLAEYTHAAQLQKPTATDLRNVALDYVLLADYPDADTWLTRAADWDPTDAETWYSLGRVKSSENRFEEALRCFDKALALSPRLVKAENNRGVALEGLNRINEAIAAYRQAIAWQEADPHPSEQPYINLGILLTDRGDLNGALPLLERAEQIAPHDGRVHGALGRLYQRLNKLPEAQSELEIATAQQPTNAPLHFQLGQVYRKEGLAQKAKAEFARAASLDATHSTPDGPQ